MRQQDTNIDKIEEIENYQEDYNFVAEIPLENILNSDYNKISLLNEDEQNKIAQIVLDTYEADKNSRDDRENKWENILELVKENGQFAKITRNKSNVVFPLIKKACKKFATKASPLVISDGNIVKAKVIGNDDGEKASFNGQNMIDPVSGQPAFLSKPGKKLKKAERRIQFENYYILNEIENYEENTDELLYRLAIYGSYFKKIYFDTTRNKIIADILFPQDVIVNNSADNSKYTIFSQILYLDYNEIISKQNLGVFVKFDFNKIAESEKENETTNETESYPDERECPQLFIEQHRWLDLDNDGFLEPYICVVHKKTKTLCGIYARFTKEDIERKGKKIVDIKARNYFIKYTFFPSPDGSYYPYGLGDLLYKGNHTVNSLFNQLIDAGILANRSGGFISKALKTRAGNTELEIGQWKFINTFGSLKDGILPIDHKEPSIVLFNLLQFLLTSYDDLVGVNPAYSQDINPNIAPMTMMAFAQEGALEFKAIFKRIYRSLKEEIKLIEDIIKDDIDKTFSKMYKEVLDCEEANFEKDYKTKDYDVVPVADINMTTDLERKAKTRMLVELSQLPQFTPFLKMDVISHKFLHQY